MTDQARGAIINAVCCFSTAGWLYTHDYSVNTITIPGAVLCIALPFWMMHSVTLLLKLAPPR